MPVTLRQTNNRFPENVALAALAVILPGFPTPNTYLASVSPSQTGAEQIIADDPWALAQLQTYPAVLLLEIEQASTRDNNTQWTDEIVIEVRYLDRWDENNQASITSIWKNIITLDLYRMQSNVQANETLTQGGAAYVVSIPHISFSNEMASGNGQNALDTTTVPGLSLVRRSMFLHMNVLPYDSIV